MKIEEAKQLIDLYVNGNGEHAPLAILVPDLDMQTELREYLENLQGAKSINCLLTAGASQYFDSKGNLVSDISQRQQLLADGSKYNAAKYLDARVNEYAKPEIKVLFDNTYAPTPEMLGVSRYIAQTTGKRLVVVAPVPVKGQDVLFGAFDIAEVK